MLVRKGHEVTVLTPNSNLDQELQVPLNQRVEIEGVSVWYFRCEDPFKKWARFFTYMSKSIGFLYCPEMWQHLTKITSEFDLVHTHLPFVYPTYIGARAARFFQKPLFYHQRGVLNPDHLQFRPFKKALYIRGFERKIMKQATTLIALTRAEVDSYRSLGIQTRCTVVPNGINAKSYIRRSNCSAKRFQLSDEALVVLFLGRLHPMKGADKLLDAFLQIHKSFPKAVLVLAGPDEWKIESTMRSTIVAAGATNRVLFTGMVSGEEKLQLLARADLFCLPSNGEGFSMAILEALASETAVLISPGCHFPEVEANNVGCVISNEPRILASGLARMLSDPGRLKSMGGRGREFVIKNYSVERITDQLIDVYAEGLDRYKASR
jgi:glycosyltransferase involved in cell wall biosynthesis